MQQEIKWIVPTDQTHYLVGAEGLVWVQPALGEAFIVAANTDEDRAKISDFIWGLLHLGLVPYGLALSHRAEVAVMGGKRLKGCTWVQHGQAPAPTGDDGDPLPTRPALIVSADTIQRRGGLAKSERKTAAVAANGRKGGRPRKAT
jgi:hypothetical protein